MLGRVTLNPLAAHRSLGHRAVALGMYALTGFLFGWAKPVLVNPRNLARRRA